MGCYEFDYAEEEFVDFAIVKYSLPDLEWSSRDLEEETLWDLYGAAYGFMENKRIPRKIKKALKYTFLYVEDVLGMERYILQEEILNGLVKLPK